MNSLSLTTNLTDEQLAQALLKRAGLDLFDAVHLIMEFQHCSPTPQATLNVKNCISIIRRGSCGFRQTDEVPTFKAAIGVFLENKRHRRPNTRQELQHYTNRFLQMNQSWHQRPLHSITMEECQQMLSVNFQNLHSRRKARVILHGFFSFCAKRGWLQHNPAAYPDEPRPSEKRIAPLPLADTITLLRTCQRSEFRCCAAAVGIMLWAGVRPTEVTRLQWEDIKLQENVLILHPQHTKTGGARCVSILPPLAWWLSCFRKEHGPLCPPNWKRRWRLLHRAAGLTPWVPDVLRHSFASFHAAHYRNFEQLQYEMGHRSLQLLRFRYLATGNISPRQAADFWTPSYWKKRLSV